MSIIRSMTGFGVAKKLSQELDISIKIQTVNSRYCDINIRMPSVYNMYEIGIRNAIRKHVSRGKVDVYLEIRDLREDSVVPVLNKAVVNAIVTVLEDIPNLSSIDKTLNVGTLLNFHQALKLENKEFDNPEEFESLLLECVEDALLQLLENRANEGSTLVLDIQSRIGTCSKLLEEISNHSRQIKLEYKDKLHERISEILESEDVDEGRLEQEVAFLVDRADITEEIVRFRSHLERFGEIITKGGEVGKKLDFLMQELNREINTIGSKAKSLEVNRIVVDVKSELEKVREQVQNIE
jgi:uncharacterized protein (TIGR00255 family)